MALTLWLCALCLQASVLAEAVQCPGAEGVFQPKHTQFENHMQQMDQALTNGLTLLRAKRQLERRGPTHLSQSSLPGAVSVKGFPNSLIQADRSRRHLVQTANKKSKRRSRVGSYSLLTHDKSTPLQVIRARRQVKNEPPSRGKIDRSGAFSVLGDPTNEGQNVQPK
ncbi:unnamed protein product [Knipowitschia caucasica]|uniref:Uncharacterized protein n=1 Tax=Knipowitschia caucasica TaxID=637954 RepID=A0AAV2LBD2_KNICA